MEASVLDDDAVLWVAGSDSLGDDVRILGVTGASEFNVVETIVSLPDKEVFGVEKSFDSFPNNVGVLWFAATLVSLIKAFSVVERN